MEKNIRRTSKGTIAAIIIGFILFCVAIGVGIVILVIKFIPRDYIGTWNCDNNEVLIISDNSFDLFKNNGTNTRLSYSVKKIDINNDEREFVIETTSGNTYKKYEITIKKNIMYMTDKEEHKIYICTKKD